MSHHSHYQQMLSEGPRGSISSVLGQPQSNKDIFSDLQELRKEVREIEYIM